MKKRKKQLPKNLKIVIDFKRGLSPIGLARKYGMTNLQIQGVIRNFMLKKGLERKRLDKLLNFY